MDESFGAGEPRQFSAVRHRIQICSGRSSEIPSSRKKPELLLLNICISVSRRKKGQKKAEQKSKRDCKWIYGKQKEVSLADKAPVVQFERVPKHRTIV